MLNRHVEKFFDLGKFHDGVKLPVDLGLSHPENGAVEVDVFAAAELRMEPSADFKE